MISAPERGGRRYWRTGEKYLPSDTGQGECGEQRPPWEIYTSFKKNRCRTRDEYYNSFLSFFFPLWWNITRSGCVCNHEKRKSARKNSGMTELVVLLVRDSKATHSNACQKKSSIWSFFPFSLMYCVPRGTVGGTHCTVRRVRHPGQATSLSASLWPRK